MSYKMVAFTQKDFSIVTGKVTKTKGKFINHYYAIIMRTKGLNNGTKYCKKKLFTT